MEPKIINRRDFLIKSAVGVGACTILPAYLTSARAADNPKLPPSQRVNLACIGIGGRAFQVIPHLCSKNISTPVAFADVDFECGKKIIEQFPNVKTYHDFRKMFDEMGKDIDAVSIITPDHTHFVATILAMSMGKHVYTEKPLTHTFEEAEILMRAEKKYGVVTQMGNQGHTSSGAMQFKQLVAEGIVRDIVKIEAWKDASLWFMNGKKRIAKFPEQESLPTSLQNWDLWCGPREVKAFSNKYHPFDWRGFYCYGGGMFGDWGSHLIDFAHDYLHMGLPTEVKAMKCVDHNKFIFPQSSHIVFKFPERGPGLPAVELDWKAGNDFEPPQASPKYAEPNSEGILQIPNLGEAGTFLHRQQDDYLIQRGHHGDISRIYPRKTMLEFGAKMKVANPPLNHQGSFIQACKGQGKTESPFHRAGVLTQVLNIGTIAEQLNQDLTFNPQTKLFGNSDMANALLRGPEPRTEWAQYYKLA